MVETFDRIQVRRLSSFTVYKIQSRKDVTISRVRGVREVTAGAKICFVLEMNSRARLFHLTLDFIASTFTPLFPCLRIVSLLENW